MHILQAYKNKWESTTITTHATVENKCQWVTLNIHVYHVFMYLCKVDYTTLNTFMYVAMSLNNNKVMRIIPVSYRIANIIEH